MAVETDISQRLVGENEGLVGQLLNDTGAGCYEGCAVRIIALGGSGEEHEVVGSVDRVDLRREVIYINEAQAIEGVSLSNIIRYEWL